jgi:hypothetical protein
MPSVPSSRHLQGNHRPRTRANVACCLAAKVNSAALIERFLVLRLAGWEPPWLGARAAGWGAGRWARGPCTVHRTYTRTPSQKRAPLSLPPPVLFLLLIL